LSPPRDRATEAAKARARAKGVTPKRLGSRR
jgi:hypothetical protein